MAAGGVRTAAVELQTGGGHRHRELIAKSRSSAVSGLMQEISSSSAMAAPVASICAPRSDEPLRALLDHAGLDEVALPGVRRRRARDLRRDDRVGDVELLGDQRALVGPHVLGEVVPTGALVANASGWAPNAAKNAPTWSGVRPIQPWVCRAQVCTARRNAARSSGCGAEVDAVGLRPVSGSIARMSDGRVGGEVVQLGDRVGSGGERRVRW